jgi:hypothetical protein
VLVDEGLALFVLGEVEGEVLHTLLSLVEVEVKHCPLQLVLPR